MTGAVVIALLAVAALAYVCLPLRRGRRAGAGEAVSPSEEADARKRAALAAIVDLENERAVGKLADADFEELRRDYELEALAALKEADAATGAGEPDVIEAEIAAMRNRLECPSCGEPRAPGRTCSRCGA